MSEQLLLSFKTKPAYNALDFVVAPSNIVAYQWLKSWPSWPGHVSLIYGPSGCGKTHLAHVWQELTHANFCSLQKLIHTNVADVFKNNACIILDNENWKQYENLMFHLYNAAHEYKGFVLLVDDNPAEIWDIHLPDLRSRLNSIPKFEIHLPDEDLKKAIVHKIIADHQLQLPPQVYQYILSRAPDNISALNAYVDDICACAFAKKKRISVELIRKNFSS